MPRRVLKFTMVRFLRRVMARYAEDQSSVLSGYIAYAAMLSAFPFMIFATAVAGLIGQHYSTEAIKLLFEVDQIGPSCHRDVSTCFELTRPAVVDSGSRSNRPSRRRGFNPISSV